MSAALIKAIADHYPSTEVSSDYSWELKTECEIIEKKSPSGYILHYYWKPIKSESWSCRPIFYHKYSCMDGDCRGYKSAYWKDNIIHFVPWCNHSDIKLQEVRFDPSNNEILNSDALVEEEE